jgi:hypothetical protein
VLLLADGLDRAARLFKPWRNLVSGAASLQALAGQAASG